MLIGVGACAVAGKRREMALGARAPGKTSIAMGLTFCVLGGIGSGLVNLGLVFGAPILKAAEAHGASRVSTTKRCVSSFDARRRYSQLDLLQLSNF